MKYDGEPVELTLAQDEIATFYAKSLTAAQLQKPKTAKIFNSNFWAGFKSYLGRNHQVKRFDKCDFSQCACCAPLARTRAACGCACRCGTRRANGVLR